MQKLKKYFLIGCAAVTLLGSANAQSLTPGAALILYDSTGEYGWVGGLYAKMLGNLLGHFPLLPYEIRPVENYRSNDVNVARATFYFGSVYENPLPATFKQDVLTTTNHVCWFKYNVWQLAGTNFEAKTGFRFNWLDWSGYSNIVYKGESFLKNQLDPELGYVTVLDANIASVPATAVKADGTSIPYVTVGGNFWYFSDTPFGYISEEDRYLVFADLLHDILGIDHAPSKSAVIRIEDVAPRMYTPAVLRATADLLAANNVPFVIALVPFYNDPLGYYNGGVPESHHMADTNDPQSTQFRDAIRYMVARGGQLLIHGYSHQYGSVANPYNGVSGDDFEFWRESFDTNTADPFDLGIYAPVAEDSAAWMLGRINAAKQEVAAAGLTAVGFESPHYAASAIDYQVIATNFPLTMHRVLYFDAAGRIAGQMFPYPIYGDAYGQTIIPENLGNIEPEPWQNYPARSAEVMIRTARKNLVIRDGWASGYFHPFFSLTNLSALVQGVKALGYTYVPLSAAEAPTITVQPVSQTVLAGSTATFTVSAVGSPTLTYQWRRNGVDLAGANDATLVIANAQSANAGNYTVAVSNAFGAVTSVVASLTMQSPPVITAQPQSRTNAVGTTATFSVTATGTSPLRYQWSFNGGEIAGATNATLTLADVQTTNAGGYSVVVTNAFGSATSSVANLLVGTLPAITTQPASRTNVAGTVATFSVVATGDPAPGYQWQFNGANLAGATSATLTLNNVQPANAGNYTVVVANPFGSVTSATAVLMVGLPPAITAQPASGTNTVGSTATFSVTATGSATLRYQWQKNGVNITDATNATLTLNNVQTSSAGTYSVAVTNAYGTVTSANATLLVGYAPTITTQPTSRTVKRGSATTFSVTATGTATLRYQWRFNGVNITSATNASYTISNVQTANAGNYSVVVANSFGSRTSNNATLTIR